LPLYLAFYEEEAGSRERGRKAKGTGMIEEEKEGNSNATIMKTEQNKKKGAVGKNHIKVI
jgi:hypothetical protein